MTSRNACVLGLGYVGLPLACAAAEAGHQVVGYDPNSARVAQLLSGSSPVEDVEDRMLEKMLASGRLTFTDRVADVQGSDTFVICVPTPLDETTTRPVRVDGAADVDRPAPAAGPAGRPGVAPPTPARPRRSCAPMLEAARPAAGRDFHLPSRPERIDPGNPRLRRCATPRRSSAASTPAAATLAAAFYARVRRRRSCRSSAPREAEMAKLLENTYRHVNIALVNELAIVLRRAGHRRLGGRSRPRRPSRSASMPFYPGPGLGGHCIPIDPFYLSWQRAQQLGYPFRFVELAGEINAAMPGYVVERVAGPAQRQRQALNGSGCWCSASPTSPTSPTCASRPRRCDPPAREQGRDVRWHDPHVPAQAIEDWCATAVEGEPDRRGASAADLVVVHTNHSAYDAASIVEHSSRVFDTRNMTAGHQAPHVFVL